MPAQPRNVLAVGAIDAAEMQPAMQTIGRQFADADVRRAEHVADIEPLLEGGWFPDLLMVCQQWPGQFTDTDVCRLSHLLPLARWVCLLGAWCESDGRNGSPWPTAVRVPARCADARLRAESAVLQGTREMLPLTAALDELFEFDAYDARAPVNVPGPIAVLTPDAELGRCIADLLRALGALPVGCSHPSARSEPDEPCAAVIVDVDPGRDAEAAPLRALHADEPDRPLIAVKTFPHPEDVAALKECGAAVVVPKRSLHRELAAALCGVFG